MSGKLDGEIAAIGDLSRDELVARWVKAHGCLPPKGIKRGLLERSAAWHLQVKRLGGLAPEVRRTLKRMVAEERPSRNLLVAGSDDETSDSAHPALSQSNGTRPNAAATDPAASNDAPRSPSPLSTSAEPSMATSPALPADPAAPPLRGRPAAGTRLVREWNGRMHVVEVTDTGFVWDGKSYRSLSAIARRITGAHWSGPRFFGL